MNAINLNQFKTLELKEMARQLGFKDSGTRSDLVLRLGAVREEQLLQVIKSLESDDEADENPMEKRMNELFSSVEQIKEQMNEMIAEKDKSNTITSSISSQNIPPATQQSLTALPINATQQLTSTPLPPLHLGPVVSREQGETIKCAVEEYLRKIQIGPVPIDYVIEDESTSSEPSTDRETNCSSNTALAQQAEIEPNQLDVDKDRLMNFIKQLEEGVFYESLMKNRSNVYVDSKCKGFDRKTVLKEFTPKSCPKKFWIFMRILFSISGQQYYFFKNYYDIRYPLTEMPPDSLYAMRLRPKMFL